MASENIDTEMTPWRTKVKNLQTQLGIGASGCFHCEHRVSCHAGISNKNILKGDWTYVGHQYGEALVGEKKAKILFVSLDRGGQGNGYEKFKATQKEFRTAAYERTNPHMGGVDVELEYLLDKTSREDRCQQFALTNSVRCRRKSRSMEYEATPIMEQNCESHTKAIIQELEPDIIIAQGNNPRKSMCRLFSPMIVPKYDNGRLGRSFRSAEIGQGKIRQGQEVLFLLTAHPANYSGFRWKKGYLPYELRKIFAQAREIYSGVQQSYCIEETNVLDQTHGSHHSREDRFFNTNETNAPGAYKKMFDQGVIAIFGYTIGRQKLMGSNAGQRVFAYVNGKGILAAGRIVDGQIMPSDTVFGQCREYHVRIEWETIVAEDKGITKEEVKGEHDYGLPIRNTFCQMHCCPDVTNWIADELQRRKASHGNP